MRNFVQLQVMLFLLITLPVLVFSQEVHQKAAFYRQELPANHSRAACDSLHFLLADHYQMFTPKERAETRNLLMVNTKWPDTRICSDHEEGSHIHLKGKLLDENGKALSQVMIYFFQADSHGYYSPDDSIHKSMGEQDPRLFGFVLTDANGVFAISSIRPASYPVRYNGRTIPQHIHLNITAKGYREHKLQLVFDDDPAMHDQHWIDWAVEQNNPLVHLTVDGKILSAAFQIVISK